MSNNQLLKTVGTTSVSLAMIGMINTGGAINTSNINWKPITNTQIVYQSATASTYWIGADKKYKFRRIFKRFNFKKMGRGKPTPNHEYFLNIWV